MVARQLPLGVIMLIFLATFPSLTSAADWYVRPYDEAGYGVADGTSYETAFNGMHGGAIKWQGIGPGDTLHVCGLHDGGGYDYLEHKAANPVMFVNGVAGAPGQPITVTGDCADDPGTIFGASMKFVDGWAVHDKYWNVYIRNCTVPPENRPTFIQGHERHRSADAIDGIVRLAKGISPAVMIMIPEAIDKLTTALMQARDLQARLVIICDTEKQARDAKQAAHELLPDHREVSLSRAQAGAWGLN